MAGKPSNASDMRAIKQNRHGKWCRECGKYYKARKTMQKAKRDTKGCGKLCKRAKKMQNVENEAKHGKRVKVGSKIKTKGRATCIRVTVSQRSNKTRETANEIKSAFQSDCQPSASIASVQRWTLGEPTSNTHCRPTACTL